MGGCLTKVEVVAFEEVKKVILQELINECRDKLIPEIIQQLQFTEKKQDELSKEQNNNISI